VLALLSGCASSKHAAAPKAPAPVSAAPVRPPPPDFVGEGVSNESAEAAAIAAKDALEKQVFDAIAKAAVARGSEGDAEPLLRLATARASSLLEDAEVTPGAQRQGRFSVRALLLRSKAVQRAKLQAERSLAELRTQIDAVDQAIRAKQAARAIRLSLGSEEVESAARADALTLAAVGDASAERIPEPTTRLSAWLGSVRLEVEGGDQTGACGRPLSRPLIVRAVLKNGSDDVPIAGLPLVFSTDDDDAKLTAPEATDSDGLAKAVIRSIGGCAADDTRGVATVDWVAFLKEAEPAQRTRWIGKLPHVSAKFRFLKRR
jgi:hypothetical protein